MTLSLFDDPTDVGTAIAGVDHWLLARSGKYSPVGAKLADGHYSRRTVGSPQFMPPGQTMVLVTADRSAVFGWWRPHPSSGIVAMNGLDGWTCTIFRNVGGGQSSMLIIEAEKALVGTGYGCGPDGLITYVWCSKIKSPNPGYCFQRADWNKTGWSADGKKRLLQKPWASAGATGCRAFTRLGPGPEVRR